MPEAACGRVAEAHGGGRRQGRALLGSLVLLGRGREPAFVESKATKENPCLLMRSVWGTELPGSEVCCLLAGPPSLSLGTATLEDVAVNHRGTGRQPQGTRTLKRPGHRMSANGEQGMGSSPVVTVLLGTWCEMTRWRGDTEPLRDRGPERPQ